MTDPDTDHEQEFPDGAVETMAETIGEFIDDIQDADEDDAKSRISIGMLNDIAKVCSAYGVEGERRIDLAVAGWRRYMQRLVDATASDFRQQLEAQHRLFGGDDRGG